MRSIVFIALFYSWTTLAGVFALPLLLSPPRGLLAFSRFWARVSLWLLRITVGLTHEIRGHENIPVGPVLFAVKHQSAWETLALQIYFPPQVWILKRELLWIPIYGWGLASMKPIAIDRSSGMRALKYIATQGKQRLERGLWVVIFPEGTRTAPGKRLKYQPGGGLLAEKSGYPVVPVTHNAGYFWPRNSLDKKPGTITMKIGPIIDPAGKSAKEITTEVEDWIENTSSTLPTPNFN